MSGPHWIVWSLIAATAVVAAVYACWPQYWTGVLLLVLIAAALTFGAVIARRAERAETAAHATGFGRRS